MADGIETELVGADELLARLKVFSDDMRLKGGRFAARKAANVVRDAIIDGARGLDRESTPESIAKNITVKFSPRVFRRSGDLQFRVGVLGGARSKSKNALNPGGDTWYWRLLEFGTSRSRARPFIRPAVERVKNRVDEEFILQYRKALDRAEKRAAREAAKKAKGL